MKISFRWLKEFIDIEESPEQIAETLTQTGLEVEKVTSVASSTETLDQLIIGQVKEIAPHPDADKLKLVMVDTGDNAFLQIICGATNVQLGQKVLVAKEGATIYPFEGDPIKIINRKIRGIQSQGMLCSENEVGLGKNHNGIMELAPNLAVGMLASEAFPFENDAIFEIGLTPNRGDGTSHLGVARDLKAVFNKPLRYPEAKAYSTNVNKPIQVSVENEEACVRYSGLTIRDVKVAPSPLWLQRKLSLLGLDAINNVVDVTNYVLHSLGQPMHAFDVDKIAKEHVVIKTLPQNTPFVTLDKQQRMLFDTDLMICDGNGEGMCIAGVFGGTKSGITDSTKNIFLESACFAPDWIRATASRHKLSTDASFRYERGTDPEGTIKALKLAASLITELAGGTVASEIVDIYPQEVIPKEISCQFSQFNRLIGIPLSTHQITETLNLLDITTDKIDQNTFVATVPAYRSDVTRVADLVEEFLRIYGFNKIPLKKQLATQYIAPISETSVHQLQEKISVFLAGYGFSEIITNSLTSSRLLQQVALDDLEAINLQNPSSEELDILKTSPLYTSLPVVAYNINRKNETLHLYEFCKQYGEKKERLAENERFTLLMTGYITRETFEDKKNEPVSFTHLKSTITSLFSFLGIKKCKTEKSNPSNGLYGVDILYNNQIIGSAIELTNNLLKTFDIKQPVFYATFDWVMLQQLYKRDVAYKALPKFPEVKRDLSLVLPKEISYAEIEKLAFETEQIFLKRIVPLSVYENDQELKDKKSYAISFFLYSKKKTLSSDEIDNCMNNLMTSFENNLAAIIRR